MRFLTLMLLVAAASGSVRADEARWYVGLSAGSTSSGFSEQQVDSFGRISLNYAGLNAQTLGTTTFDDSDATWSIVGGYRISRFFSIEAAYADLGSTKYKYTGEAGRIGGLRIPPLPITYQPATSSVSIDSSSFALKGLGIVPIGDRFNVHAHLGAFIANTEITASGGIQSRSFSGTVDDDSQDLMYGAGVGYRFHERWMLSVDWQRYAGLGVDQDAVEESAVSFTLEDVDGDIDTLTLSLLLDF